MARTGAAIELALAEVGVEFLRSPKSEGVRLRRLRAP
jgi:hypothetical protein